MNLWLVSARFDLAIFLVPAAVALLLVPLGPLLSPSGELPFPMWILCVLLVDVAHVWATIYRTYLDRAELARRPLFYTAVPIAAFLFALSLALISISAFWTGLAYLAVFHFVRQQYGWVALYNRKDRSLTSADRAIDAAAIYAATIFPILWWHAHLPRSFEWFVPGDFFAGVVSPELMPFLWPVYVGSLALFALRQLQRRAAGEPLRTGKIVVVVTTALCWGVGIVATDTDWAFTATNVIIHGVPYFGLVWVRCRQTDYPSGSFLGWLFRKERILPFYGLLLLLAALEELGWDRVLAGSGLPALVALLALPQVTHYLLDGFIWRKSWA